MNRKWKAQGKRYMQENPDESNIEAQAYSIILRFTKPKKLWINNQICVLIIWEMDAIKYILDIISF